jgi:hypothetical protein
VIPCQDRHQGNGCEHAPCDGVREPCHLQITSAKQALRTGHAGWSGLLTAASGVQGILGGIVERRGPQDRALGQPAPQVGPVQEERLRAFKVGPTVGICVGLSETSRGAATLVRLRLSQAVSPCFASFPSSFPSSLPSSFPLFPFVVPFVFLPTFRFCSATLSLRPSYDSDVERAWDEPRVRPTASFATGILCDQRASPLRTLVSAHHRLQDPDRDLKSRCKEEPEESEQYRAKGKRKLADINCAHVAAA